MRCLGTALKAAASRRTPEANAIITRHMGNCTERDLAPDPREMPRRRFMIAGEHVILRAFDREGTDHDIVIFSVFRDGTPQQEAS